MKEVWKTGDDEDDTIRLKHGDDVVVQMERLVIEADVKTAA